MLDFDRLKSQYYSEPFEPYIYTGICHKCLNGEYPPKNKNIRRGSEGKEIGFKLYVRLTCPNNPEHNGKWSYHGKRPWKFRIKKYFNRVIIFKFIK